MKARKEIREHDMTRTISRAAMRRYDKHEMARDKTISLSAEKVSAKELDN